MEQKVMKQLDQLIVEIGGNGTGTRSGDSGGLLLEHLRAARRDLLGSMTGEYRVSLRQAKDSLSCIADKSRRGEIKQTLQKLIDPVPPVKK